MNMRQSVLKISVLSLVLLGNAVSFGMKCDHKGSLVVNNKKTMYKKPLYDENELKRAFDCDSSKEVYCSQETCLPIEVIESAAACAHDDTKNAVKMTCKYLYRVVSTDNTMFVSNPLFSTDEKKIHRLAIVNSWKQNIPMVNALRKHLPDDGIVTIPHFTKCGIRGTHIKGFSKKLSIEYPGQLNEKYSNGKINPSLAIKSEVDLAMYCAVLSNDAAAIKKVVPIIQGLYLNTNRYGCSAVQNSLLDLAIEKDNEDAFECLAQHDPYNVRNYTDITDDGKTYLDFLNSSGFRGITQEERDKYGPLYKKHGGTTYKEMNPSSCIIS